MYIKIKKGDIHINGLVYFDTNGNAYIDLSYYSGLFDNVQFLVYQICVDGNNNIMFDPHEYPIIYNNEIKLGKFVEEDIEEEKDDKNEDNNCEEYMENVNPYDLVSTKYYYEEKKSCYFLDLEDDETSYFTFYNNSNDNGINIENRENGDILSLYDTLIYQNSTNIFRSKLIGDAPLYILKLYDNGTIQFRELIDINNEEEYYISIDDDGHIYLT